MVKAGSGVGVASDVAVRVGVCVGDGVTVGVEVGGVVAVGTGVGVSAGVTVTRLCVVGVGVDVGTSVGVAVLVGTEVGVEVAGDSLVRVAIAVGVIKRGKTASEKPGIRPQARAPPPPISSANTANTAQIGNLFFRQKSEEVLASGRTTESGSSSFSSDVSP